MVDGRRSGGQDVGSGESGTTSLAIILAWSRGATMTISKALVRGIFQFFHIPDTLQANK